jgi:Fructosamine-3-kinase
LTDYLKYNSSAFTDFLTKEAQGLDALRRLAPAGDVSVVEVFAVDEHCLKMTRVESVQPQVKHWKSLARGLATIHEYRQPWYGFYNDNYIGQSPQINSKAESWGEFFIENRLRFQVDKIASATIRKHFSAVLANVEVRLATFLNETCSHPSLIHGDLWFGNVLFSGSEHAWLIDPAVYYGDSEADLAMTEMFGGFSSCFYQSYNALRPLSPEYGIKKEIYNLYHSLNHLNLFGEGYLAGCESGMNALLTL